MAVGEVTYFMKGPIPTIKNEPQKRTVEIVQEIATYLNSMECESYNVFLGYRVYPGYRKDKWKLLVIFGDVAVPDKEKQDEIRTRIRSFMMEDTYDETPLIRNRDVMSAAIPWHVGPEWRHLTKLQVLRNAHFLTARLGVRSVSDERAHSRLCIEGSKIGLTSIVLRGLLTVTPKGDGQEKMDTTFGEIMERLAYDPITDGP